MPSSNAVKEGAYTQRVQMHEGSHLSRASPNSKLTIGKTPRLLKGMDSSIKVAINGSGKEARLLKSRLVEKEKKMDLSSLIDQIEKHQSRQY